MIPSVLYNLLHLAQKAAVKAGEEILTFYHSGNFEEEIKNDNSPVTTADVVSHQSITKLLATSTFPVLSEEGASIPYHKRKEWEYFWMIDPLDGTVEFLQRTGDFSVNIAFIHGQTPIMGVVYLPVHQMLFFAMKGFGAFKDEKNDIQRISAASFRWKDAELKVVASRTNYNKETDEYIRQLNNPKLTHAGGALKFMQIASGNAHVYPRFAPTMEWDTAAAQIIVEEAGGKVCKTDGKTPLTYNKENLQNPYFVAFGKLNGD